MKKNRIFFKCLYLSSIFLLFFVGHKVENSIRKQQKSFNSSTASFTKEAVDHINQMYDETELNLMGSNCPREPAEAGSFVETAVDFVMPDDSELEGWKAYEFRMDQSEKKKKAEEIAKVLFGEYFPKAEKEVKDYGQYGVYHLNYHNEKVLFQFKYLFKMGAQGNFTHSNSHSDFPEPEDGNWENCYLENNEKMIKELKLGLWDGNQSYLELTEQLGNSDSSTYMYRVVLDGIPVADESFNFTYNSKPYSTNASPIIFTYRDGVMTGMQDNGMYYELNDIRDVEMKYTSMQELLDEVMEKERTMLLLQDPNNPRYYYTRIDGIKLGYMRYCYGNLKRKWVFIPVAVFKQTEGAYVINEKRWEWYMDSYCYYGVQLETGEGYKGTDR